MEIKSKKGAVRHVVDTPVQHVAEAALALAASRYQELFDDAPVMYLIVRDKAGVPIIDECNARFLTTLGYERNDVIGAPLVDFYSPGSQEAMLTGGYAAALAGRVSAVDRQLVRRDGSIADVLVFTRPETGDDGEPRGIHLSLIDVSDRKAAESALRDSVEQSQTLLASALDAVIATDADGAIVEFNVAAERMFSYRRDDVLGAPMANLLMPSELRTTLANDFGRALETGQGLPLGKRVQTGAVRADGTDVPIELTVTRIDNSRGPMFVAYLRDVSDRIASEAAQRASEERFRALVQNSYDVITVVNRDGSRRYVSPSVEHLLGYAPAELTGADVLSLVHPEDGPAFRYAIDECLKGAAQTPALEVRFRHRDGSWRDFETVGTNLLDEPGVEGIVFNSREITARKATETALRESELRFRAAFDHAPIGLALVSADGQFTQVNRALCELLGFTEGDLLQMTLQDMSYPEDREDDLAVARRLFAGEIETYQLETRSMGKDGHIIWIELTVSAIQERDGRRSGIAQIQDVSGRRRLDMERATMLASERAYIKQLRDLAGMREDLSQMVAHELRTPVASLRMMVSAVATGALEPDAEAEMFRAIHGQIDQLARLVSDVVAAAAAERDDFSVQLHTVPLAMLVSGATAFALGSLGDRQFTVGPVPDVEVWCDPERISQVLQNLLDNIARHTPPDTTVELRAANDGRFVHIEVADNGPGISEDDLQIIFEKFGRGRESAEGGTPGLGLGLYLSRQIVQAHGADLAVQSTPEHGTVFGFDLRVAQ